MAETPHEEGAMDSDSMDSSPSPKHAPHHSSSRRRRQGSISWADQCTENASCEATEESEGEGQSTSLLPPQDEQDPVEGTTVSRQESSDTTSDMGDLPGDSQEEVIIHAAEAKIDSLC